MKNLSPSQIKVGDILIRRDDHLQRPNHSVTVLEKRTSSGTTEYRLAHYFRDWETARALCAQGYRIVDRNGTELPEHFFTRYW